MKRRAMAAALAAVLTIPVFAQKSDGDADVIFRAMKDEMDRARALSVVNLDRPYYIEYDLDDSDGLSIIASLGGLIDARRNRMRIPRTQVRVGDYKFDNTNYAYTDFFQRNDGQWPWENNYEVLRHLLWLATDRSYKGGVQAIGRKRAALKDVNSAELPPDFAKAEPVQRVLPVRPQTFDQARWTAIAKQVSAVFSKYPQVLDSRVEMSLSNGTYYMANSEGTRLRLPDNLSSVRIRARGRAKDGMPVHDSVTVQALLASDLPAEAELRRLAEQIAQNVTAMSAAPTAESYTGPVLFEGQAAGQLLAQLVGSNLMLNRKPVNETRGENLPISPSEFETRLGTRILPDWMNIVDDPQHAPINGKPLLGNYEIDYEGVPAKPVTVVEKGKLKSFLFTRQPVKDFAASNGRARMPGLFGARSAVFSNLIVEAAEAKPLADVKKQLLSIIKDRSLPFGLLVRKLDFPSTAIAEDLQGLRGTLSPGGPRPVSFPLLVYRVYPDGREELVRGLRFRGLNAKALKDITAASSEQTVFDYQNNLAPFALVGAGNYITACAVVSPSLLFEELDLEKQQDELPKPPLVPPPSLSDGQ